MVIERKNGVFYGYRGYHRVQVNFLEKKPPLIEPGKRGFQDSAVFYYSPS